MKRMFEKWVLGVAMVFCALLSIPVMAKADTMIDLPITVEEDYTTAHELFDLINEERARRGLEPYILDGAVTEYAMHRAAECAVMFYHLRPNDSGSADDGYDEDIAAGQTSAQEVFNDWMGSPGHLRVIVNPEGGAGHIYKYCGIGCVTYGNTMYWVLNTDMKSVMYNGESVPYGKKLKSTVIQWSLDIGTRYLPSFYIGNDGNVIAGDRNGLFSSSVYILDPYENIETAGGNPGLGYQVPASLVNISVADPTIADVIPNAQGFLCPIGYKPGTTMVTITLKQNPSVTNTLPITVKPQSGSGFGGGVSYNYKLALEKFRFTYEGKPVEPKLRYCKDWFDNEMVEGRDYKLVYKNNDAPGTGTVEVWLIGDYEDRDNPSGNLIQTYTFAILEPETEPDTEPDVELEPQPEPGPSVGEKPEESEETTESPGETDPDTEPSTPETPDTDTDDKDPGKDTEKPEETESEHTETPDTPGETEPKEPETPSPSEPTEPGQPGETTPPEQTQPETPAPSQPETPAPQQTEPPKQTEAPQQTEPPKQTEAPKPVGTMSVTLSKTSLTYTGKAQTPAVTVMFNGSVLAEQYYSVSYKNNKAVGTATVTVAGKGDYAGYTANASFEIKAKKIKVKLSYTSLTYNGKSRKPSAKVYYNGKKISSKYYSVSYENNKKPGIATVTVTGKSSYKYSSATATFEIKPKAPKLSAVKATSKKKVTVKWKPATGASGHQVQYSTSSSFKSGSNTKKVSGSTKDNVTLTGLKSGKTYYVRVRAYKSANGEKIYGSWSDKMKVKAK